MGIKYKNNHCGCGCDCDCDFDLDFDINFKKQKNDCNCKDDCLCRLLGKLRGENVTLRTRSGDFIEGELQSVRDCCVRIFESGSVSPVVVNRLTVIRCEDIESFSVEMMNGGLF